MLRLPPVEPIIDQIAQMWRNAKKMRDHLGALQALSLLLLPVGSRTARWTHRDIIHLVSSDVAVGVGDLVLVDIKGRNSRKHGCCIKHGMRAPMGSSMTLRLLHRRSARSTQNEPSIAAKRVGLCHVFQRGSSNTRMLCCANPVSSLQHQCSSQSASPVLDPTKIGDLGGRGGLSRRTRLCRRS